MINIFSLSSLAWLTDTVVAALIKHGGFWQFAGFSLKPTMASDMTLHCPSTNCGFTELVASIDINHGGLQPAMAVSNWLLPTSLIWWHQWHFNWTWWLCSPWWITKYHMAVWMGLKSTFVDFRPKVLEFRTRGQVSGTRSLWYHYISCHVFSSYL